MPTLSDKPEVNTVISTYTLTYRYRGTEIYFLRNGTDKGIH